MERGFKYLFPLAVVAVIICFLCGCNQSTKDSSDELRPITTVEQTTHQSGYYVEKVSNSYLLYKDGIRQRDFSGLKLLKISELESKKTYYYFTYGVLDQTAKGLVQNDEDIVYVANGRIDNTFSGEVSQGGFQWTVDKGKVTGGPNGTTKVDGKNYKVKDGNIVGISN